MVAPPSALFGGGYSEILLPPRHDKIVRGIIGNVLTPLNRTERDWMGQPPRRFFAVRYDRVPKPSRPALRISV